MKSVELYGSDEVLGVTVGVVGLSLTSAMDEILLFLGAS